MPTHDLRVFQPGYPAVPAVVTATGGGVLAFGVVGLTERFVARLFTRKGTVAHAPECGTPFLEDMEYRVRTEPDAYVSFSRAAAEVRRQFQREAAAADTNDDRMHSATLDRLTVEGVAVFLTIRVRALSGAEGVIYIQVPSR